MSTERLLRTTIALVVLALCAACSRDPQIAKREYFESGNRYYKEKKFREAIVEYRNAVNLDPNFGEARAKLATAYLRVGDAGNAIREQVRAADLLPNDADAQVDAGNLLLLAGKFEDAKARATRALTIDPRHLKAQILSGNAHAGLKEFDAAITDVEEALKLDPDRISTYASLGTLRLAQGDRAAAEETFKQALARHPTSVDAQLAAASFYWAIGQMAEAESLLTKAVTGAPENVRANRALAILYIGTKRVAQAEPHLVSAAKFDEGDGNRVGLADYYIAMRRANDAKPLLDAVPAESPWFSQARIRLAGLDLRAGRIDEAERILDGLMKDGAQNLDAQLMKATILLKKNKADEAAKLIEGAVQANPRSARAHFARGKLALLQRRTDDARNAFTEVLRINPRAADAQWQLSRLHLAEGAVNTSMDLAGQAVRNDASNLDARLLLARGLVAQRQFDKAGAILEQLASAFPKSATVHAQLGFVLALKKDVAGATRQFDEALALDPDNLEATAGLISLDLVTRQPAKARERAANRAARTPNDSNAQLLAGRTYAAIGDKAAAEQAIRQAIQADPSNLTVYEALGTFYMGSNRLDDALREFEGLAARQDRPVASLTMVAMIHQRQNRSQDARATYERILQVDPAAAVAANNLAWMYAETGENLDVAMQLAKTAKAKLPKSAEVSDTLGWIYYRKGLFSLAIAELEESVTRSPSNPVFQFHLGMTYAKSGDRERARKALETALRLKPDFNGAAEAKSLLASL